MKNKWKMIRYFNKAGLCYDVVAYIQETINSAIQTGTLSTVKADKMQVLQVNRMKCIRKINMLVLLARLLLTSRHRKRRKKMAHFLKSTVNLCAGGLPTVMLYQKFDGGHATRKQTHTHTLHTFKEDSTQSCIVIKLDFLVFPEKKHFLIVWDVIEDVHLQAKKDIHPKKLPY